MVSALVFTRNRPAQLDLLLRSIAQFSDAGLITMPVDVLWRSDSIAYNEGYALVAEAHPWVEWTGEAGGAWDQGFQDCVRAWLKRANGPIMFLVDDNVFYRSLRKPPAPARFPWSFRGGDYHYPFSVDGCVYQAEAVRKLLKGLTFTNPTELEQAGHEHRHRWTHHERQFTYGYPCLTNVPMNRVSESSTMPHQGIDEEGLNRRFLAGWRLGIPPDRDYPPHANIDLELSNPERMREVRAAGV